MCMNCPTSHTPKPQIVEELYSQNGSNSWLGTAALKHLCSQSKEHLLCARTPRLDPGAWDKLARPGPEPSIFVFEAIINMSLRFSIIYHAEVIFFHFCEKILEKEVVLFFRSSTPRCLATRFAQKDTQSMLVELNFHLLAIEMTTLYNFKVQILKCTIYLIISFNFVRKIWGKNLY